MIAALILGAALAAGPGRTPAGPGPAPAVHVVAAGDTLWAVTGARWGDPFLWPRLYTANRTVIGADPDRIYPGQRLRLILASGPASWRAAVTVTVVPRDHDDGDGHISAAGGNSAAPGDSGTGGGTLGCAGLEALWAAAGGPGRAAFTAAEVAIAESGGRQYATGPAGERGYWQINPDHGVLSTYDPFGNARAAVIISGRGTDWSPWTTWVDGAYRGLC